MTLRLLLIKPWFVRVYIAGIASISIFGAFYLSSQIKILKQDIPGIVTSKRNAAATALRLINSLKEDIVNPDFSLHSIRSRKPPSPVETKIRMDVDIISNSAHTLENLNEKLPSALTVQTAEILKELAQSGEKALAAEGPARTDRAIEFLEKLNRTYVSLLSYIRHKTILQLATAQEQKDRLENTTVAAAALLCVFAMFATATGLLLRAELASQERRRTAEQRARFLAYHDPLTQLSNRTLFAEQTASMTAIGRTPILILIDLDDFQAVNDSFGHGVGDALLIETAKRIKKFTEKRNGVAARLGGDEFALMLPQHANLSSAQALCLELAATITQLFQANEISFTPSASIGAVRGDALTSRSMSDILTSADLALFEAKRNKQSDFVIYNEDLAQKAQYRREIKDAVPDALKNDEFELHFQPQIHLDTGRLHGFEALVRWRRNGTLMPPGDFIPILEETGHIRLLDLWVLRKAVVTAAQWLEIRRRPIAVSVNLSPLHFQFDDIVGHVKQALKATALPPHFLTLEITENVLLDNWDKVTKTMADLTALGVSLSLDDFGTGYSSLAYLRNLKVNELKIDRAFLTDIETSSQTKIILNSIVEIAKGLGMSIVVEGIETLEQRDIVRSFGAQTGQGFLFGRPVSKDKILEIIKSETKSVLDWNKKAEADSRSVSACVA